MRDLQAGRFSIARFYARRVRRLFPALLVVLLFCFVVGYVLLTPQQFEELGRTAVSTAFFVSNVHFWQLTGYFGDAAAEKPLLHTWSLAVEEQFYLFFPLFLYVLWRSRPRPCIVLPGCHLRLSAFAAMDAGTYPLAPSFSCPARAFELLIGALLALSIDGLNFSPRTSELLAVLGLRGSPRAFSCSPRRRPSPASRRPCDLECRGDHRRLQRKPALGRRLLASTRSSLSG